MPSALDERDYSRWLWPLSNCAVAVFGFLLVWICGHRGLFLLDQSMMFDGAWRLLQGQVPYRDVLYPFGPLAFVIQALFFKVFGVDFSTTVLSAAVLNAIAGLLVIRIVSLLLPGQRVTALMAGLVTACWFQAPFGTLWFEQTAFFFGLLGLLAALKGESAEGSRSYYLHGLAGLLAALSVLSKQNAGLLFFVVLAGTVVVAHIRDLRVAMARLAAQIGGLLIGLGCFVVWLWLFSDPRQFFHYSIEVTRSLAAARTPTNPVLFLGNLVTFSAFPPSIKWCGVFFALPGVAALIAGLFHWPKTDSQSKVCALAGWIIIACLEFQQLFILVTANESVNGVPFLGLAGGLALGLLSVVLGQKGVQFSMVSGERSLQARISGPAGRRLVLVASIVLWGALIGQGVRVSWIRAVQQFDAGTRFTETLDVDGMRRVKWSDLSYSGRLAISTGVNRENQGHEWWLRKSDFEGLNQWIAHNPGNFFVFGDSTLLYGLHRRVSPQPWLYFLDGHSYLDSDLPHVDEAVVTSLCRNAIRTVIIEKVSWAGYQDAGWLPHMPKLNAWIGDNFAKEKEFGIFEVWVAKPKLAWCSNI
jgi:hypothetical protein